MKKVRVILSILLLFILLGGFLYQNNGNWQGEQILPDMPRDMYSCRGHYGQFIYIIPSKELVIVRTGFSKNGQFDHNGFIAGIVGAVK